LVVSENRTVATTNTVMTSTYTTTRDSPELYDHASDPMEWTNLATNDSYSMQLDVSSSLLNEAMSGTRTAAHFDGSDARRDSAQRVAPAFAGRLGALRRLVWHPHQHLWNWDLMALLHRLPGGRLLERAAISVDSLMLALSSLARGVARGIGTARVLYIDCGTHQDGLQLRAVSEWLGSSVARLHLVGFEARLTHFAAAERSLADIPDLELHQVALVGPEHEGASAKLYITGGDGKGDSLYPERGTDYEAVPAARLSSFLPSSPDEYDAVLLRMNIEGAEAFVIDDLIDADALGRIDGFYGMWDDLSKIDRRRDAGFRRILRRHDVHTFTFNDRDFDSRLRLWAIRRHVRASVARAHRAN
jgi:hypothetical protein